MGSAQHGYCRDAASKPASLIPPFAITRELIANKGNESLHLLGTTERRDQVLRHLRDDDLEVMHQQLWYAGRRGNISPLHHQRVLCREIILTERPRLHLVWFERTIYVQRLDDELLNWTFFSIIACRDEIIYQAATGFLLSYMRLIQYPSDLAIAQDIGLVNKSISWHAWQAFRADVLHQLADRDIHDRFEYGELRLGRLNQIFRLRLRGLAYFTVYRDYSSYFGDNYKTLIAVFAIVTVGLSAMQVMAAFDRLPRDAVTVLYRTAIATLVAVLGSCGFLFMLYIALYLWNWLLIFQRREV